MSRLVLPIAGVRVLSGDDGGFPAPSLGWRGAILEELDAGAWSRVLEPRQSTRRKRLP